MLEAALAGLFGLLIGSFLNVCIYRLPRDLSVVQPRSFCPHCERTIAWYDNVPLLSYLLLRGHCRNCAAPIPFRYPLVELLTGILFFCAVYAIGPNLRAVKFCAFGAILVELIFSDLEERILPDEFTLGGALVGIAFAAFVPISGSVARVLFPSEHYGWLVSVFESAFSAGFFAFVLWSVGALYARLRGREGLGLGDVKMVAMMGAFLGIQGVLLALIVGSTMGAVIGLLYIAIQRKDAATYELPFGTFLGVAALLVAFYGDIMITWWGRLG